MEISVERVRIVAVAARVFRNGYIYTVDSRQTVAEAQKRLQGFYRNLSRRLLFMKYSKRELRMADFCLTSLIAEPIEGVNFGDY